MKDPARPAPGCPAGAAAPRGFAVAVDLAAAQVTVRGPATGAGGGAYLAPAPGVTLVFDRVGGWLSGMTVALSPVGCALPDNAVAWIAEMFGTATAAAVRDASPVERRPLALRGRTRALRAASRLARLDAARVTSPVPASPLWDAEAADLARRACLALHRPIPSLADRSASGRADRPSAVSADLGASPPATVRCLLALGHPWPGAGGRPAPENDGPGVHSFLDPGLVPPGIFRFGLWPDVDLVPQAGPRSSPLIMVEAALLPGATAEGLAGCRARLVDAAGRRVLAAAPLNVCGASQAAAGGRAGPAPRAWAALPVTAEVCALIRSGVIWAEIVGDERRPADGARLRHVRRALRWADAALRAESCPDGLAAGLADAQWASLAALAWDRCRADWEAAGRPVRAGLAATRGTAGRPLPFLAEAVGDPAALR